MPDSSTSSLVINLHRDERRRDHFAAHVNGPAVYDQVARAFVALNPEQAEAVLRCPYVRTSMCDSVPGFQRFTSLAGIDLPNIMFALKHLPLSNEGEVHREQRRRLVVLMKENRLCEDTIADMIGRHTQILERPGDVDMINDVLLPLQRENSARYTRVRLDPEIDSGGLPTIFDPYISRRKKLQLEATIANVRAGIRESLGNMPEEEEGTILAFQILGRDPIVGSFGESLYRLFKDASGSRICDIALPEYPNETSVAVSERIASVACVHAGQHFDAGEPIRIQYQAFSYSPDPSDRSKIFGLGVHSCLGRRMSMDLWEALSRRLAGIPWRVEVLEYGLREPDYLFTVPGKLLIRLSA